MRTTNNPVLSRDDIFTRGGYAGFHDAPPSTPDAAAAPIGLSDAGPAMTINDVVAKTAFIFVAGALGVGVAAVTGFSGVVGFVAMFVALGLCFANIFMRQVQPGLVLLYAVAEGVFLGWISDAYSQWASSNHPGGTNIVLQALIGTATAFAVMLALYSSGKLRATPMFQRIMYAALASYLLIALVSFASALFGVGGGFGFYGVGLFGIALCAAGVLLASFTLILDFDAIQKGVEAGVPERESWRAAFGLAVTLVWLYLEILRLLALLQGRR